MAKASDKALPIRLSVPDQAPIKSSRSLSFETNGYVIFVHVFSVFFVYIFVKKIKINVFNQLFNQSFIQISISLAISQSDLDVFGLVQILLLLFLFSSSFHRLEVILDDPWVIFGFFQAHSVFGVGFQETGDKVFDFRAEMRGVIEIKFPDFPHHIFSIFAFGKRCKPSRELIGQDPKTPEVKPKVIIFLESNLRTDVIRSTTISFSSLGRIGDMNGPAKISEFDLIIN